MSGTTYNGAASMRASRTANGTQARSIRPSWISGVCADLAFRAAVPVWLPRVAFVIFGMLHCVLATILYFVLAKVLCPNVRGRVFDRFAAPPAPPASYAFGAVRERFRNLDERLSNLEAATVQSEAELRRAFRDLERK